jgi:hypothetical protein
MGLSDDDDGAALPPLPVALTRGDNMAPRRRDINADLDEAHIARPASARTRLLLLSNILSLLCYGTAQTHCRLQAIELCRLSLAIGRASRITLAAATCNSLWTRSTTPLSPMVHGALQPPKRLPSMRSSVTVSVMLSATIRLAASVYEIRDLYNPCY